MHIVLHRELYVHWSHRIIIFLLALWNVSMTIVVHKLFTGAWQLVYLSFQVSSEAMVLLYKHFVLYSGCNGNIYILMQYRF